MNALEDRAIHLWPVSLRLRADASIAAPLSQDEAARAARFAFEGDRDAYVAARAALRIVLGSYLGEAPAAIEFAYGARGKPRLAGVTAASGLRFNVSHKANVALLAVTRGCDVGVDIERVGKLDDRDAVAKRFFSSDESAELRALPEADRDLAFYRCWTRKEAFLKCTGDGLYAPLDGFRVSLSPGEAARVVTIEGDTNGARLWTMHDLAIADGYVAALAYREAERPVRVMPMRSVIEPFARAD